MIAQLSGKVVARNERGLILDVNGVGYKLALSVESLRLIPKEPGSALKLFTYLAVRENALDLYGFVTEREHDYFVLLLDVSGIGPKSALTILSLATPDILERAISGGDSSYLTKISGIGKKTAEKIVLELKDKLGGLAAGSQEMQTKLGGEAEVVEALQALGYSLRQAREALQNLPADLTTSEQVKTALKNLGKAHH